MNLTIGAYIGIGVGVLIVFCLIIALTYLGLFIRHRKLYLKLYIEEYTFIQDYKSNLKHWKQIEKRLKDRTELYNKLKTKLQTLANVSDRAYILKYIRHIKKQNYIDELIVDSFHKKKQRYKQIQETIKTTFRLWN
jgi:hypothetical protein